MRHRGEQAAALVNVLLALGIRHVGWETAGLFAQHAGSLGLLERQRRVAP